MPPFSEVCQGARFDEVAPVHVDVTSESGWYLVGILGSRGVYETQVGGFRRWVGRSGALDVLL